jgi:hypothetical protein
MINHKTPTPRNRKVPQGPPATRSRSAAQRRKRGEDTSE